MAVKTTPWLAIPMWNMATRFEELEAAGYRLSGYSEEEVTNLAIQATRATGVVLLVVKAVAVVEPATPSVTSIDTSPLDGQS